MNKLPLFKWPKMITRTMLLFVLVTFSMSLQSVNLASAGSSLSQDACGQKLADAKAIFLSTLAPDGSVPASPETKAAAAEYIRVSKLCYETLNTPSQTGDLQTGAPSFIDDGGILVGSDSSAQFVLSDYKTKWGSSTLGTPGGTVTYSFMGANISFSDEGYGNSVAFSSLPNFQPCFITDVQYAFAAWQAVSNIKFAMVGDNGAAFNASGATGDIRIGAHAFDGPSGTLAHAYYPPPNWVSAAGDIHFDSAENWSCSTSSGIDIGVVALHEIGHSLGLAHENTSTVAVMDPYYNSSLTGLQTDDMNGAQSIYGGAVPLAAAPPNDNISSPTSIGSLPFSQTLDTTGAAPAGDGPQGQVLCDGKYINKGKYNVWYTYTVTGSSQKVSFDTFGSYTSTGDYDTYIAVWTSGLGFVGCGDDTANYLQSQVVLKLAPGTYYIEVAQYDGDNSANHDPYAAGGILKFHAIESGGADTVGVFRPSNGVIFLKNQNTTGYADIAINYGQGGDYPVAGDWDGNGTTTIGIYRSGTFYLRNSNTIGYADSYFPFTSGTPGDQPIAGDWNGDGIDTIGIYNTRTITFYLRNSNTAGPADYVFRLGIPGDVGIAGDWTNKGFDTVGVFRPSNGIIFLKNANDTGYADIAINYGQGGDKPVTGDWDGNGTDTIGVLRGNVFYLRNSNDIGYANASFALGNPGDMPIAGNWDGIP